MMKVYLVLLALSTVGIVLALISTTLIGHDRFTRVGRNPAYITILAWVRTFIVNFFIIPGLSILLLHIFNYSAIEKVIIENFEKNENWVKKG